MEKLIRGTVPGAAGEAEWSRTARSKRSPQESQGIRGAAAAGAIEPVHDELSSGWRSRGGERGCLLEGAPQQEAPAESVVLLRNFSPALLAQISHAPSNLAASLQR